MRPYIIINNKPSYEINGLLIQTLPPITKPPVRVVLDEIAGRDGDIATLQGYNAYDKTMSVGLYGDYNVDQVIEYLSQGGEIRFSNEIDKYYNYAQYEQIDYEKLIRYKTAEVMLHVQPFKYDAIDRKIEVNNSDSKGCKIDIRNRGNIPSRPKITITGTGIIRLYVGDKMIIILTLQSQTAVLDVADGNVRDGNGNYINRQVKGDLLSLVLPVGDNELSIRGNVTEVIVEDYSRWL